jgi:ssDNA-binding Zn-finger/Zn-ribbon topoisomerase 1
MDNMRTFELEKRPEIECPSCGSTANYRYGKVKTGQRRLRCVLCGRQFIIGAKRVVVLNRPSCRLCGKPMHLYKRDGNSLRFRCSNYPKCKTYTKAAPVKEFSHAWDRLRITA